MSTPTAIPPVSDELEIAVRAYTQASEPKQRSSHAKPNRPPQWALIFDTETTADPGQALRFGTYQLQHFGVLKEAGIFYDPEGVTSAELDTLYAYAKRHCLTLRTRDAFVDDVFYRVAYRCYAAIIGFNLPFDISRLAISHNSARVSKDGMARAMRGGFTFRLSRRKWPHVRVKHLSRKAALIDFAAPIGQRFARSQRKRETRGTINRGQFVDVNTFANAQLARPFTLTGLCKFLKIENPKLEFDEFDSQISDTMIRYAVRDVQATWECYCALLERFDGLGLKQTTPNKIYSEASIGKACINAMGIRPWREMQPNFPPELLGSIMGSYYGGRSEVRIRREIRQVILCDFLSMYPTVCTLMGLWRFVTAEGMQWRDATEEARCLLDGISLLDLETPCLWKQLHMLVRVVPKGEIFPVRAAYAGGPQMTIGANHLTSEQPLWFTLADCIAAKLLTGQAPEVIDAIAFTPKSTQSDLKPIKVGGNDAYRVDPAQDDFFRRVIELRQATKRQIKDATGGERQALDTEQHALKILANSTSYGIWVEVNVDEPASRKTVTVYGTCKPFEFRAKLIEEPGQFFHPLLATLITGAARLMLVIAESLANERQLDWAFCDTDSMAFARPDGMKDDEFGQRVQEIVNWFAKLNPYEFFGSILKIEDVNLGLGSEEPEALHCFAISAKRYALFNLASDGSPVMRKVSAHGLGHLRPPYDEHQVPANLPVPDESVLRDGTARWHCDFWHQIVNAALAGAPDRVQRGWHPAMDNPAVSRYGATTPTLLRWFATHNRNRPYREQVKPFNFMLALSAERDMVGECLLVERKPGRPKRQKAVKPIAPFSRNPADVVSRTFDRESGDPIASNLLKSASDVLAQYHLHPEGKFLGGNYVDRGTTERRHVCAVHIRLMGKESNDWERQAQLGLDEDAQPEYGARGGVNRKQVRRVKQQQDRAAELEHLRAMVANDGLRETARKLGVDPSNFRRKIR